MKVLIVSDTHGNCYYLERVIKKVGPIDLMIHLGDFGEEAEYIQSLPDCPVEMVSGNNDFFSSFPRESFITLGKYYIMLTHGHRYQVSYGIERLKTAAHYQGANIVMFGHTHMPLIDLSDDEIYAVNPGSISFPRQEGRQPSFLLMEIDNDGEVHFALNYVD